MRSQLASDLRKHPTQLPRPGAVWVKQLLAPKRHAVSWLVRRSLDQRLSLLSRTRGLHSRMPTVLTHDCQPSLTR